MKRMTNIEVVEDIMSFSKFGALSQIFVMDAIMKCAEMTSKVDPATMPEHGLINNHAWVGVAKEILGKLQRQTDSVQQSLCDDNQEEEAC